ncbi:MAG: RNA-directed DNA polymerase [Clostridia bacterium]|nr:RNA-directed DNA polymerase [Clostridia bacterium]
MITKTFEETFTYEALYRAHLRGRRCKRDKKPLIRFEMTMLSHLNELHLELMNGKYKVGRYHSFIVEEPKKREIQTLPYENRVVQHVICDDLLAPYFLRHTIVDNCACQEGKGAHFALNRFETKLKDYVRQYGRNGYFLKCDILKYFPSMPHELLAQTVCKHIQDEKIKKLVRDIIESYHAGQTFLDKYGIESLGKDGTKTGRGIPIGNQTSQVFGMFYLDKVDRLVKEKLRFKVYSRYMDDFVLLHQDLDYVKYALEEIRKVVKELGLYLNAKTQIFPIKNGVTYLGFRFIVTEDCKVVKVVKKQTKRRLRWRARLLKKAYIENLIPIERVKASQAAFHGHLTHARSYKFERELNAKLNFEDKGEITKDGKSRRQGVEPAQQGD